MYVTEQLKAALYDDGVITLPNMVPRERVDRALRAINSALGTQGLPPADLPRFRAQSYCPDLQRTPEIVGLLTETPLWSVAETLIGMGKIQPVSAGQIALRFPTMDEPRAPSPHLDGMYTPSNGVPTGTIANFTALIGVFLSDVSGALAGNLSVWPGTHQLYERFFQQHGPQALLEGMPPIALPAVHQITARAGDAMLCHYQLAHGVAGNGSPHTRYAIFFRLSHVNHAALHWDCMTDIWREWAGMTDIVRARTTAHTS